ncbi:MAG: YCF48-related protein [Pyrinomonadaceae bacterium]
MTPIGLLVVLCLSVSAFVCSPPNDWRILSESEVSDAAAVDSLFFLDHNHGLAVAGALLETKDGGKSWTQKHAPQGELYYSMSFVNEETGWLVGTTINADTGLNPLILKTTDGGRRWQKQVLTDLPQESNGQPVYLTRINFCDPDVGWASGPNVIIRTVDGGETWQVKYLNNGAVRVADVVCINANSSYAVGDNGVILTTNNGGDDWINQESGTKANLLRVRSFDTTLWLLANDATVLHMPTGGRGIQLQKLDFYGTVRDIYFKNSDGWIVGTKGTIFHTDNGGKTWRMQTSPTANNLTSVFILDQKHGWAGGDDQTILGFSK